MTATTDTAERPTVKTALVYVRVSTAEQAHGAGSTEGYSIPAQRDACQRKATELGAEVIAVFADRGASARSADRPHLQALLAHLAQQGGIDYVIVHKIDRLARNRADDVEIQIAIERAGAQLVSVSESVDKTPSGKLVRNIMADLAEFYSANLATEILKGSTEKARRGGTPGLAPIGYLNVRRAVDGHEVRTVVIDEERAPFVRRAFALYATGEYSVRQLRHRLTEDGLTVRATAKRPAQPVTLSKLYALLHNRYYLGFVTYRGVEYPGLHVPLITPELFAQVAAILDERDQTATKQRTHTHYLRGLLTCARCGSRLNYTQVRGRRGGQFSYYVCSRRHRAQGCDLPYLPADTIEHRIETAWPHTVRLDQLDATALAEQFSAAITATDQQRATAAKHAATKLARLETERRKLLELAYAEAIPLDLLRSEQQRIAREQLNAQRDHASSQAAAEQVEHTFRQATRLMQQGAAIYATAPDEARRQLNRAFLATITLDADEQELGLASPWREITEATHYLRERPAPSAGHGRNTIAPRNQRKNPGRIFTVEGSKMFEMVELLGRYSNYPQPLLFGQLAGRQWVRKPAKPAKSPTPRVHAVQRRLSADTIQQLVTDYQAGTPSTQLMVSYNLGKGTVLRLLREHDVQLRNQRMSSSEIDQAIQLYGQGLSIAAVGTKLGYGEGTIWRALKRAGVPRRDPHGRDR